MENLLQQLKQIPRKLVSLVAYTWDNLSFALLLMITVIYQSISSILAAPLTFRSKKYQKATAAVPISFASKVQRVVTDIYIAIAKLLERRNKRTISRVDLMDLSFKTIWVKRARSIITMGSIAVAVSFIVFLLSIGFGLQQVVISRAVKLNEMKQADIAPGLSEELQLNDSTLATMEQLRNVESVYPVISSVGRISYENSSFDVAVYGVTTDYLVESAISPTRGRVFDSNQLSLLEEPKPAESEEVMGAASEGTLEVIHLEENGDEDSPDTTEVPKLRIQSSLPREIVVNEAFLEIMGVSESAAIDQEITVELIVMGELLNDSSISIESLPERYKIVGITPENSVPVAYIPFVDMRSLGVDRFSQLRVVVDSPEVLTDVRISIESLGYSTTSVADTVSQIESFFASLRIILAIFGVVALAVASLGMFNTLTVSLLERTHEVGLLKALGMSSAEIREIFLSESMIMGFFGGIVGLILGILASKFLGVALSTVSVARGGDIIDISATPPILIVSIILLSLLIGLVTGWYPSRRAMKISALNALRYE